jgi:hypothetical protein
MTRIWSCSRLFLSFFHCCRCYVCQKTQASKVSPEQLAAVAAIKSNKTGTDFVTATCENLQDKEAVKK